MDERTRHARVFRIGAATLATPWLAGGAMWAATGLLWAGLLAWLIGFAVAVYFLDALRRWEMAQDEMADHEHL